MSAQYDSAVHRPLAFSLQVLPAVGYAAAIFYGGLIRMAALPEVGFVATDKLLHAAAFGGLALLLVRALRYSRPGATLRQCAWLGALGSSALGALLEVCQAFVPYRSSDALDWLADTVGAVLAVGGLLALLCVLPRRAEG